MAVFGHYSKAGSKYLCVRDDTVAQSTYVETEAAARQWFVHALGPLAFVTFVPQDNGITLAQSVDPGPLNPRRLETGTIRLLESGIPRVLE